MPANFTVKKITLGQENAKNMANEKELVKRIQFIAPNPKFKDVDQTESYYVQYPDRLAQMRFVTPIDARFYMGRSSQASTVYCSVWIHNRNGEFSAGRGSAGGYGYDKESQALEEALNSAGVTFTTHWGGMGESAMTRAITLLGHRLGYRAGGLI